jgi:hypothetical protein
MGLYIKNVRLTECFYFIEKILFKFKILTRIILKYKIQRKSQQVERM